jgi:hypothetical protein
MYGAATATAPYMLYNCGMLNFMKRSTLPLWIALMAILFSALAPSISQAVNASSGKSIFAEICTVNGAKVVAVDGDTQKPANDPLQHHMKHCPYCGTHGGTFALLPPAAIEFAVLGGPDRHPSLFYQAPAPLFAWSAAHPRGPPAA